MAQDFSDKLNVPRYSYDELELIGDLTFTIGLPEKSTTEFKKRVFAAAKSYSLQSKSIDSVLKAYSKFWNFDTEKKDKVQGLTFEIIEFVRNNIKNEIKRMYSLKNLPDHFGLFNAGIALLRLEHTFRSSILMQKFKMYFESMCINRLILEQLAWIYSIYELNDDRIFKVKPTKCITNLSQIIPIAGRVYGNLSKGAHMEPVFTLDFLNLSKGQLIVSSPVKNLTNAYYLALLTDFFIIVEEIIFRAYYKNFNSIRIIRDKIKLKETRSTKKIINDFEKKVSKIIKVV